MVTRKTPAARIAFAAAFVLVLVLVPAALAGKGKPGGGGGGGGGSTTGGSYSVTLDKAGPYSIGETVMVSTNTPVYPNNTGPWIGMKCYQNGVMVGSDVHSGFLGGWYYNTPFYFGPSLSWTSGAADCTFTVYHTSNSKIVNDATLTVHVG